MFAFVLGFLIFYFHFPGFIFNQGRESSSSQAVQQKWEARTDDQGSVTVTVTPIDLSPQAKEWTFDIAMSTHSIELQSPATSTVLIDDQGKEYKPLSWNGPTEGHHMNGILTFSVIMPLPKSIELKISSPGDAVRSFMWQIKE